MNTNITKIALIALMGLVFGTFGTTQANAQFSKAVVLLKGSVHSEQSGKPFSVKISIRSSEDQKVEVTNSVSNSETGNYLVVLETNKKYYIHIEGSDIATQDELIETPAAKNTVKINKDITVSSAVSNSQDKASLK